MLKRHPARAARTVKIEHPKVPGIWFRVVSHPLDAKRLQVLQRCIADGDALQRKAQQYQASEEESTWEALQACCERLERLYDVLLEHFLVDWNFARIEADGRVWFCDHVLDRLPESPPCSPKNKKLLARCAKAEIAFTITGHLSAPLKGL